MKVKRLSSARATGYVERFEHNHAICRTENERSARLDPSISRFQSGENHIGVNTADFLRTNVGFLRTEPTVSPADNAEHAVRDDPRRTDLAKTVVRVSLFND